jgi:tetratricopeptide (TPR) repeat protein
MTGRRWISCALTMIAASLGAAVATPAHAEPSVWVRAREPRVTMQDALVRDAERAYKNYRRRALSRSSPMPSLAALELRDTREALARAVNAGARDFSLRMFYAAVLRDSLERDEALKVLQKLLADAPPDPIRAEALADLAILHAHAGRRDEEIRAYTQALALEPHGLARHQLIANRAEAMMALGDVTAAVEGYRAALAVLTTVEMFWRGSTTLFSLGVALDRSGNPDAGMESIRLARSYDPHDKGLSRGSWFFSPAYDAHWYRALGSWTCGRSGTGWALRAECYEKAIAEWELYIESAPETDPWAMLARVRLATVKREREELKRAFEAHKRSEAGRRETLDEGRRQHHP